MNGWVFARYLLVMAGVTYAVRALPLLLFRRPIRSPFVLSVLHYTPYAVLAAMTIPEILYATGNVLSAALGLCAALLAAWRGRPMVVVAIAGSAVAVVAELALTYLA